MFLGQYEHTIDNKGRLAIPARFRAALAEGLYLTAGVDRCLAILTPQAFQAMAEELARLPWQEAAVRQVRRNIFAGAVHLVPDKLGRIVIPQYLRQHAGLESDVIVAGVFDRIEVWDRPTWNQQQGDFTEHGVEQVQGLASIIHGPRT